MCDVCLSVCDICLCVMSVSVYDVCLSLCVGTPEIGGLTTIQALEILQGCRGLNIVGGDLVEVGTASLFSLVTSL